MTAATINARVQRESVEDTSRRLRTLIGRMEHRYECPSEEIVTALAAGRVRETAEIARWLAAWDFLRELNAQGDTIGTLTTTTR